MITWLKKRGETGLGWWAEYGEAVRDWFFLVTTISTAIVLAHYGVAVLDIVLRVIAMAIL